MRVISGSRKGIPLKSLAGNLTRPTSDKVKESIFNMIGPYFDGGIVVELFGGSGSLSIESLSRGADEAYIFEKNPKACSIIRENVAKCRFTDEVHIIRNDARNAVKSLQSSPTINIDLLFIDPPYAEEKYYDLTLEIVKAGLLSNHAIIVCEHEKHLTLPESYGEYIKTKNPIYGNSAISIYMK
ncbi:16S rRNA (guanine(966)-N(2))-methyltransferase RsmD [Sporosarcina highlanderae]|uniref:16S rRNA (Guanine(966)-N(2))-methyltransferase RsmD n=1 Tax=Sporosarcina highlanderae TaxID=3035916 RepID=A0ABT8JRC4_9BACL|nr:16S rRNA (guanine(966)-N(2))-methyltransferase RsmD [Sporosarcina highlanderae]MDN4607572.1 16S rRNA (guanine(966)-N(2))-methyltransferase RsmD [Sporosarcina highlanderae]